ncbi:anti-adapter protein IraP [Cronobacter dublinensis]|nr:anti-adapter protein IraP [Cronobacter dublinensis]ELQ6133759.1 anti-adapter protein IraP [Cronobacter dublinensis]ELQ6171566.1 anti-adapter protein IraP [Cronobacter dublinensis]ELY4001386.1 anti-adapter protein IraP [Cronobacter dublinensis]
MNNVIYSMIAKISKMDAEAKILTAQVEAQALLLSAMLMTIGKNGGMEEMVEGVKKAINAALDAEDNPLKSDTELLLSQFNELLSVACLLDKEKPELDVNALRKLSSSLTSEKKF